MAVARNLDVLSQSMDISGAMKRLGNDIDLLEQIIEIYLEDAPTLVHAAREALAADNSAEVRRAAHSLKSMMATLGAQAGANACLRLENCAAAGDMSAASGLIHECGQFVAQLTQSLQAYLGSGDDSAA